MNVIQASAPSFQPAIRAGRRVGKEKENAPATGGEGLQEKILNTEHLVQTLQRVISTKDCAYCFESSWLYVSSEKKRQNPSVEFNETLPGPHALRSVAEDIQTNQAGTRIHTDSQASLEVKSNFGKQNKK